MLCMKLCCYMCPIHPFTGVDLSTSTTQGQMFATSHRCSLWDKFISNTYTNIGARRWPRSLVTCAHLHNVWYGIQKLYIAKQTIGSRAWAADPSLRDGINFGSS